MERHGADSASGSRPGLGKVASTYAPYFGALVLLRLCRVKACLADYQMRCRLHAFPCTPFPDWQSCYVFSKKCINYVDFGNHHEYNNTVFLDSSMVEHTAVNRGVVGSSPTRGVFLFLKIV